ncbi:MAG: lysophospholipid acyltransferase family protein [Acidobacteriota bacterium]
MSPRQTGPRARLRRWLRRRLLARILRVVSWLAAKLSWRGAQRVGAALAVLGYPLARRDRGRAHEHLALAMPELSESEREAIVRANFRHFGLSGLELLHALRRPPLDVARHVRFEGVEIIDQLRAEKRPILLVTGHCGNWELISLANHAHGVGFAAMARELEDPAAHGLAVRLRDHFGTETIARGSGSSARQLLRALRSGKVLAMLIDQDIATDGVWVPFFGHLAHTPRAVADLALRLGAAVVPAFDERLDDGTHRAVFHPPLELPDDPVGATAVMTAAIEAQVRRRPEQWVWMHRRWRRRPPADET